MKKNGRLNAITHEAIQVAYQNNLVVPYLGHIFKADMIGLLACSSGFPQDIRGYPVDLTEVQKDKLDGILHETMTDARDSYFEHIKIANQNATNLLNDAINELTKQDENVE